MDRSFIHGQGGFFHGFTQLGVGVTGAGDVFGRGGEFHADRDFHNQITGGRADDMTAEQFIGFCISENFGETV